jgi:phage-related tail protein
MSVCGEFDVMQKKDANAPALWSDFEGLRDSLQSSIQLIADCLDADVQAVQTKLQETDTSVKAVQTQVTTLQTSVDALTQSVEAVRVMMQRNEAQRTETQFDDCNTSPFVDQV